VTLLFANLYFDENMAVELEALLAHEGSLPSQPGPSVCLAPMIQLNSHMHQRMVIAW